MKTLKRAGFGFILGMAIGNLIAVLTGYPDLFSAGLLAKTGSPAAAALLQTLLSGVLGAVAFAGTMLYEIDRWPLALTALVHFAVIEAVYIPISLVLCWMKTAAEIAVSAAVQAVIYLIIFFILCAVYRAQVRKLNELQKEQNEKQHNEGKE